MYNDFNCKLIREQREFRRTSVLPVCANIGIYTLITSLSMYIVCVYLQDVALSVQKYMHNILCACAPQLVCCYINCRNSCKPIRV